MTRGLGLALTLTLTRFLGGEAPSLVDLQYISHVERMLASLLYWKGLPLRATGQLPNMDAWLAAFEARPA